MRVVCWNMNSRRANQDAWDRLFDLQPDLALLSEVNGLPSDLRGYDWHSETAIGKRGTPQRFSTAIMARGRIGAPVDIASDHEWVNQGLAAFPGNFVGRRVKVAGAAFNVFSVHMPSWAFPLEKFTDGDGAEVAIPGYKPIYMSELFWSALRHSLPDSMSPWIIGGDFNTSEFIGSTRKQNEANRTAIARLHDLGLIEVVRHASGGPAPSWLSARPSANLKHQLDHLYVSGALLPRLRSAEVRPEIEFGTRFSDHLPIVADFQ